MAGLREKSLKAAIQASAQGKEFPYVSHVRSNSMSASIIAKLETGDRRPQYDNDGNRRIEAPNTGQLKDRSMAVSRNIGDAETAMQILPDLKLAAQMLISSILSPKDMMTAEINYLPPEDLVTSELAQLLIQRIKDYFQTNYKIKTYLSTMLYDILFYSGSYPIVVIPENSIDEAINGKPVITMESLGEFFQPDGTPNNVGYLGNPIKGPEVNNGRFISNESFRMTSFSAPREYDPSWKFEDSSETFVSIIDNINVLKVPRIEQKVRETRVKDLIRRRGRTNTLSMESGGLRMNDRELTGLLFKERRYKYQPITALKTQDQLNRYTVGEPLIMKLPSESVIPVYIPGNPERQIGYFVLIDANGNPVSRKGSPDFYREFNHRMNAGGSFPTAMLNKVSSQMQGFNCADQRHMDYSARVYGDMLEADLLSRFRNGNIYKQSLSIARFDELYRIMFARTLAKQHTQLLWVPAELMTYMAFDYNEDGIGKSLMDDMKILNSQRTMLQFAATMAALKNSIGRTEVKLKLDEKDPNPQKTIELMITEIARTRQQAFPVGTQNPVDLVEWMGRAGFEFTFEGHPGIPDVGVDFGEKNSNYTKPDTELMEDLRKQSIMGMGLSPEMVDSAQGAEFATSIVTNNILLSKRVIQYQDKFTPFLSDHAHKVLYNSENIMNDLANELRTNFDKIILTDKIRDFVKDDIRGKELIIEQTLEDFVNGIELELPRPDSVSLENQLKAMEIHEQILEKALDSWINSQFFTTDTGGEVASQADTMRAMVKAYFMRDYMAKNGIMPELADLIKSNEDGTAAVDIYGSQIELLSGLIRSFSEFMAGMHPAKQAGDNVMNAIGVDGMGGGGGMDSGGSDDGMGGTDDTGGGEDDFNMDDVPDLDAGEPQEDDLNEDEQDDEETQTNEESESSTTTSSDGSTTTTSSSSSSSRSVGL